MKNKRCRTSPVWPINKYFGKAKLNKGGSHRRDKLVDELTIHGLPLALKAQSWPARFFWLVLFTIAFAGLVYELYKIYQNISSTPTMINLQQQKETLLNFPEFTICSTQSFNVTKLFADGISMDVSDFLATSDSASMTKNVTEEEADLIEVKRNRIFRKVKSWKEFLEIYGVQCQQFFVKCQTGWWEFDCCEHFRTLYTLDQGVCFSFQILLKTPYFANPYYSGGPRWNGLTIGIPYLWDPFVTSTGNFLLVQIRASKSIRDQETDCRTPENWMNRDAGCPQHKWKEAIEEYCNCTLYMMSGSSKTICDPFSFKLCQRDYQVHIMNHYSSLAKKDCLLSLCQEWSFQVSLSYADINRAWVKSVVGEAEMNQQYTLLNIYYPSLVYTEITEFKQVTFENIISSVGGLMGLWIGASMISVIQLMVYGLQYLSDKFVDWIQVKNPRNEIY